MKTQKGFKSILLILLGLVVIGGGVYLYKNKFSKSVLIEDSDSFVLGGIWKYAEVSKESNVNGITTPVWEYILSINKNDETKGTLNIDGHQTLTRLNVKIQIINDSANVIFDSYAEGNQFEVYKTGDILLTISPDSDKNLMIDWYKMQPNLEENKTGAIFKKQNEVSANDTLPTSKIIENNSQLKDEPVACTMDAKQCPDGSYVGRSGPNCEFVCPTLNIIKSPWNGNYLYENKYTIFNLSIHEGEATLVDDGLQTEIRFNAKTQELDGKLLVLFESYGSDDMFKNGYKKGDLLFVMNKTGDKYIITWAKFQGLSENLTDEIKKID